MDGIIDQGKIRSSSGFIRCGVPHWDYQSSQRTQRGGCGLRDPSQEKKKKDLDLCLVLMCTAYV